MGCPNQYSYLYRYSSFLEAEETSKGFNTRHGEALRLLGKPVTNLNASDWEHIAVLITTTVATVVISSLAKNLQRATILPVRGVVLRVPD